MLPLVLRLTSQLPQSAVPGAVRSDHQVEGLREPFGWVSTTLQMGCFFVRLNPVVKLLSTTPMCPSSWYTSALYDNPLASPLHPSPRCLKRPLTTRYSLRCPQA